MDYKVYIKELENSQCSYFALILPNGNEWISQFIEQLVASDMNEFWKKINVLIKEKKYEEKSRIWLNEVALELTLCEGKNMFKIFSPAMMPFGGSFSYISPEDFKELLEIWMQEKTEFTKNPKEYKEKLKNTDAIIEEY